MKKSEEILERLKKESEKLEIPESLQPEQMCRRLEQKAAGKTGRIRHFRGKTVAAAAGICLVLAGTACFWSQGWFLTGQKENNAQADLKAFEEEQGAGDGEDMEEEADRLSFAQVTYEEIYDSMQQVWQTEQSLSDRETDEIPAGEAGTRSGSAQELQKEWSALDTSGDMPFSSTNVQTAGVEEGDVVKNDGRYLYQVIYVQKDGKEEQAVQIVDTRDGLEETGRLEGFSDIHEIYVWQDVLVVIESGYLDQVRAENGFTVCYDLAYDRNCYHEISFYDIADRSRPKKYKTFTLQGRYQASRIADGYFYGFSRFDASPGEGKTDYEAYVPTLDGIRLAAKDILLPEGEKGISYLVMVSVDLKNPTSFVQTRGIVSDSSLYYVSADSIYMAEYRQTESDREGQDGESRSAGTGERRFFRSDRTILTRFSYENGRFVLQARGEIPGCLESSFSLDEYQGYLRAVTTVRRYLVREITDDRTGQVLGEEMVWEEKSNSLYVLDEDLQLTGKIEGLAENEQIYAARFFGKTGYFVTFRQTDPLFAVDLSEPSAPRVLGELKVSGFSDYLHFYGKDLLLGIGMEADEETGQQQGLKLSMFDISDPAQVKEIAKLNLEDYNYSEALYNHRAVLIDPGENLFGFEAEGSQRGNYWRKYLVFSYEEEGFVQQMKLEAKGSASGYGAGGYISVRGAFIGSKFYLLGRDGSVRSYDRGGGAQLECLEP